MNFPRGPKDRKEDLPEDWFREETTLFLTRNGNPYGKVNLDHFAQVSVVEDPKPGDFRKIHASTLANNKNQVVYLSVLFEAEC